MTNWFGPESWGAPICRDCPRCDIPVGEKCGTCDVTITAADHGIVVPCIGFPDRALMAFHLDCHIRSILPRTMWPRFGVTE